MKNIENLVTDLETSKAPQEAGIKYDTAFVYAQRQIGDYILVLARDVTQLCGVKKTIPAFTAGELMLILPYAIIKNKGSYDEMEYNLGIFKECDNNIRASYDTLDCTNSLKIFHNKLPHQALAKLCLWCKGEGYL